MEIADREGLPLHLTLAALTYWPWLVKEILKSGWQVARIILDPKLPVSPALVRFAPSQRSTARPGHPRQLDHAHAGHHHGRGRARRVPGPRADPRRRGRPRRQRDGPAREPLRGECVCSPPPRERCWWRWSLVLARAVLGPDGVRPPAGDEHDRHARRAAARGARLPHRTAGVPRPRDRLRPAQHRRHDRRAQVLPATGASANERAALDLASWVLLVAGGLVLRRRRRWACCACPTSTRASTRRASRDAVGAGLVLAGLLLQAGSVLVALKLLVVGLLIFFTSPAATHALARAALDRGAASHGSADHPRAAHRRWRWWWSRSRSRATSSASWCSPASTAS